jgi:RND family efflux transporter MFP subunit
MSFAKQVFLCVVLAAAAFAGWFVYENPQMVGLARESAGENAPRAGAGSNRIPGLIGGRGAVNVITAAVATDEGGETLVALGTAKATRSITLFPQVTGMVAEISFTPGEAVEAGDVLIRLDSDEQQVAVDRARIALQQAEAAVERSATLAESKTISPVALSDAETTAQLAEVELRSAAIELERRSIAAPFAGFTGLTDLSLGDLVSSTTPVTTLDDLSTIRVGFEVPERWAGRITQGQAIEASAQALPGSRFEGSIVGIDNRIDEVTRTLRLEAELRNEGDALKTGMAITVELAFAGDQHLSVPTLSVQWDRGGSFVWKVVDGGARRAGIDIVRRQSGVVMVVGELQAGDKVVVEGIQRLREGATVTEVGEEPALLEEGDSPGDDGPAAEEPAVSGGEPARTRVRS